MVENIDAQKTPNVAGTLCALAAAVLFGALVPFSKTLLASFTPLQLGAIMLLAAGVGAGVVAAARAVVSPGAQAQPATTGPASASRRATVIGQDAPKLALMAALNALAVGCLMFGVAETYAANASALMGFEVAAATVCGWVFFRKHVCYKAIVAVGLICAASVCMLWNAENPVEFVPASLLVLAACALRGLEGCLKRTMVGKDPALIACMRSIGAGAVLLVAALVVDGAPTAAPQAVVGAVALGFATFGAGASLHLSALSQLGPARSEGYHALAPFIGVLVSWSLFGFELEPLFFGGLALMALGVWLAMDDNVFHEDVLAALDQERMAEYTSGAHAFDARRAHKAAIR